MTDKQIIDGCDVSGCEWYTQGATGMICADWHISNDCSKNPNCYYKQLKRKEQECERWISHFNCKMSTTAELLQQLYQLKAENEELKRQNNQFDIGINEQFSKIIELEGRNNLLKQTLTGIKEIANYKDDFLMNPDDYCEMSKRLKQILQKISEVEDEG